MQPIHYFRPKAHVLGSFAPFGCCKCTIAKSDPMMLFWHEFRPMKLCLIFSAKMHPTHYVWSKAHVLGSFAPFGCHKYTVAKSGPGMPFGHEFGPMKLLSSFTAKTHPIHYFRYKTHNLGGFAPFHYSKYTIAKSGPGMPFGHRFGPMKQFLSFPAKTHLLTLLRVPIYVPQAH